MVYFSVLKIHLHLGAVPPIFLSYLIVFHEMDLTRNNSKNFARDFLRNTAKTINIRDKERFENEKAKIVSVLAQNLYTMFTLSKEQMKI